MCRKRRVPILGAQLADLDHPNLARLRILLPVERVHDLHLRLALSVGRQHGARLGGQLGDGLRERNLGPGKVGVVRGRLPGGVVGHRCVEIAYDVRTLSTARYPWGRHPPSLAGSAHRLCPVVPAVPIVEPAAGRLGARDLPTVAIGIVTSGSVIGHQERAVPYAELAANVGRRQVQTPPDRTLRVGRHQLKVRPSHSGGYQPLIADHVSKDDRRGLGPGQGADRRGP
jgi:hypothetical protein